MYPIFSRSPRAFGFLAVAALSFFVGNVAAQTFSTIHTFDGTTEGNVTYPALVQGADGRLYGVNSTGGRSNNGTIFSLPLGGGNSNFQTLNTFTQTNQGTTPEGGIVQARDGDFYGTTSTGGSSGYGTFYQCVPGTGKLTILAQFTNGNPGGTPLGAPTEAIDGTVVGTASHGGSTNYGTVYAANLSTGVVGVLAQITGGLAGFYPQSDLIQATDGNFYGTTYQGGTYGYGTFFQVTPGGVLTTLYSFTGGADGGRPTRGVIQGTDGLFYGVCNTGGQYGSGAIWRIASINTTFSLTTLHGFLPLAGDGSKPQSGLIQASDGNFYGTATAGGINASTGVSGNGIIYRTTATGGYDVLYSFTNGTDGGSPIASLVQATDGNLYGTTAGTNGQLGTVFRLNVGAPTLTPRPTYLLQSNATAGDTLLIKGDNFVGTSAVLFAGSNGVAVSTTGFTVLSRTVLQVTVPDGAVTGPVSVVANGNTGTSPTSLTVAVVTPPPVVLSTVSVLADPAVASKTTGAKGKFVLNRADGDNSAALTVSYKVRGSSTAILGTDYTLLGPDNVALGRSGSVTIPAGKGSVKIKVKPIKTTAIGPTTTVDFKLLAGDGYVVGTPKKATVQIESSGTTEQ